MYDYASLAPKLFKPRRKNVSALRTRFEGVTSPREVWEVLASEGWIPFEWVSDETRGVGYGSWVLASCSKCGGSGQNPGYAKKTSCLSCEGLGVLADRTPGTVHSLWPLSVEDCLVFAADSEGIKTAEALAGEWIARASLWQPDLAQKKVEWRVGRVPSTKELGTYAFPPSSFLQESFPASVPPDERRALFAGLDAWNAALGNRAPEGFVRRGCQAARCHREYEYNAALGAFTPVRGRSAMKDLPNPFEPLLELFATGYAFDEVLRDTLVLCAPPLPGAQLSA